MPFELKIIPTALLPEYKQQVGIDLQAAFDNLRDAEISTDTFSFYTSVSAVFSSKIEGEDIELDSYIKHKKFGIEFLPDYIRKIDDLYDAYTFAQSNLLNKVNIAKTHQLLSKHIVAKHYQGKIRAHNMYVSTPDGRIEYVAATHFEVPGEMEKLYADIALLLAAKMDIKEVFYFAAMIHLVFVKIHPFNDGNGRTGRLLEKWFIQSEKYYYQQHQTYYKNLRLLGLEYPDLDYTKAMPFLLMLPNSLQ